mmetsp:Transcript_31176/g.99394  ORF Transcript_31176/g.99394 Transcript_31176/m.99394 type:complete len:336 (+) Transcript_31176:748-1755(+)
MEGCAPDPSCALPEAGVQEMLPLSLCCPLCACAWCQSDGPNSCTWHPSLQQRCDALCVSNLPQCVRARAAADLTKGLGALGSLAETSHARSFARLQVAADPQPSNAAQAIELPFLQAAPFSWSPLASSACHEGAQRPIAAPGAQRHVGTPLGSSVRSSWRHGLGSLHPCVRQWPEGSGLRRAMVSAAPCGCYETPLLTMSTLLMKPRQADFFATALSSWPRWSSALCECSVSSSAKATLARPLRANRGRLCYAPRGCVSSRGAAPASCFVLAPAAARGTEATWAVCSREGDGRSPPAVSFRSITHVALSEPVIGSRRRMPGPLRPPAFQRSRYCR